MTIEIRKPELERLVREEILSGHFASVDELPTEALQALRERNAPAQDTNRPRKNLAQFLLESPFAGVRSESGTAAGLRSASRSVSGFLLDTNVLSEFSRSAIPPNPKVQRWVSRRNPTIYSPAS